MISDFFQFLNEVPEARWIIVSCAVCLTALAIWYPKNWKPSLPFQKKSCHNCQNKKARSSLKPNPIAAPNPNIYRKSIIFNKKNIEFDIHFNNDDETAPGFLEDPLHHEPENKTWPNYTLEIRCIDPLHRTERDALHQYLQHEGYIDAAQEFYKNLK